LILPGQRKRKFDWTLGAAIIAAPFFWWLLSITVVPARLPGSSALLSQRFLMVAILYPVLEEIVFRGLLQGWLRKQSWGTKTVLGISNANLTVSVLFTAVHLARRFNLWSLAVFVPSLVFGFFRDRYGTLYTPISLHVFYNAGIVLLFSA